LLAKALAWAAVSPEARNETFNINNGDVFCWRDVWPAIADVFGMEIGEPQPTRLSEVMPLRGPEWADLVDRYRLEAPADMAAFVGGSWAYADILLGGRGYRPAPAFLSTVKLRQAGFGECMDTEDMFRQWFAELQARRLLPCPLG
jgi:hypothetical protein